MVYVAVAFAGTNAVELASVVPVQVLVVVLNPEDAQTMSFTVSATPEVSVSFAVLVNITACPGVFGESSTKALKSGLWFTSNGDELVAAVP